MQNHETVPRDMTSGPISLLQGRRIVFVFTLLELGGAERQALLLADYLIREQKAIVEFWALEGAPGRLAEMCAEIGIPSRIVRLPWWAGNRERLRGLARLTRALRKFRADIILPYLIVPNVACGIVWRATGASVCIWNQRDEGRFGIGDWAERMAVLSTPHFLANSSHGADALAQTFGIDRDAIRVVRNGVQLARPLQDRTMWRRQLEVDNDCFLSCMVANLHGFKDHVTILKAWRIVADRLAESGREAVLLLAGRHDDTHLKLKALAYDLELGRKVRFLGQVKDVAGLLGAVDLGVHSSINEGCPNGILECMAAGLAVVGTDYPGIREAIGPAGYLFLAHPEDEQNFADQVLRLAFDPKRRAELGAANRLRIQTEFSPERMCRESAGFMINALCKNTSGEVSSWDQRKAVSNHSESVPQITGKTS